MNVQKEQIYQELARLTHRKLEAIQDDVLLKNLVAESFVLIEIMIELQETYGVRIQQQDMMGIQTVGDLVQLVLAKTH